MFMDSIAVVGEESEANSCGLPITKTLVAWLLAVVGADLLLWNHLPGFGWGLFALLLLLLVFLCRPTQSWRRQVPLLTLFILSVLQTGRFISMSNLLTLLAILVILAGDAYWVNLRTRWARWVEICLGYLRPLATLCRLADLSKADLFGGAGRWLRIGAPALLACVVFGSLLSSGNPILADAAHYLGERISSKLTYLKLEPERLFFLVFMACATFPLLAPPRKPLLGERLATGWPEFGKQDTNVRLQQWRWSLALLNLLFLVTNVVDVIFLWLGREVPPGVNPSEYVHEGVYILTATTVLSAGFMALLLQHSSEVRSDKWVKWGCQVWLVQNLILISGVFLRLWLYIQALGYTSKRVYVVLFLILVLSGYVLLVYAFRKHKDLRWLVGSNMVLIFSFFAFQQFLDIPGFVAGRNLELYREGEIQFPDWAFVDSLGSAALPLLVGIYEQPRPDSNDAESAAEFLNTLTRRSAPFWEQHKSFLAYQGRAAHNLELYREWQDRR